MIKNISILAVVTFFLLITPLSFASQISTHDVTITLSDDAAHFNVSVLYEELTTNKVYYVAYSKVTNLRAYDSQGELVCQTESRPYGVEIACAPHDEKRQKYQVVLNYESPNLVYQSADAKVFTYTHSVREPTKSMNVLLVLPEGTGIVDEPGFQPYYPVTGIVGGTGRRATINWLIENPPLGKATIFNAYFEPISGTGDQTLIIFAILSALVAIAYIVLKSKKGGTDKTKMVLSVLKPEEKSVLEAIQEKGENCRQRDLVRITDFSKARISRILEDMEKRGIVGRTRVGRTNKVRIKDQTLKIPKKKEEKKSKELTPFS